MTKKSDKKFNFKETIKRIEEINTWFEKEDIDLDEALERYREGVKLIKEAKKELKEAENEFKTIREEMEEK